MFGKDGLCATGHDRDAQVKVNVRESESNSKFLPVHVWKMRNFARNELKIQTC